MYSSKFEFTPDAAVEEEARRYAAAVQLARRSFGVALDGI
jgi:hypothetical protein